MPPSVQVDLDRAHFEGQSQGRNANFFLMSLVWYLKSTARDIFHPGESSVSTCVTYLKPNYKPPALLSSLPPSDHHLPLASAASHWSHSNIGT